MVGPQSGINLRDKQLRHPTSLPQESSSCNRRQPQGEARDPIIPAGEPPNHAIMFGTMAFLYKVMSRNPLPPCGIAFAPARPMLSLRSRTLS